MTRTIYEVQAVFPTMEACEAAMARLMASGYDQANFDLRWHNLNTEGEWCEPETPAPPSGDNETVAKGVVILTMRARDDGEQARLVSRVRAAGAARALALMRLE